MKQTFQFYDRLIESGLTKVQAMVIASELEIRAIRMKSSILKWVMTSLIFGSTWIPLIFSVYEKHLVLF